ncbi:MAG: phosphotransferase, partial [Clostridia bacterium]|nr:phosphotransferase [Clostridia bacterium]
DGSFWRCYRFIDDSVTFNSTENLNIIEETGRAFGEFQLYLTDYPVSDLFISIPHFHNTENRYKIFKEAIEADAGKRKVNVQEEIDEYLALEELATQMYKMQKRGELKLRVTHNDTKCNNVLFDKSTLKHLCVIDLDTVMPGLAGFDFGDAIRFTANSANEDEVDLSKVYLDLNKFEAFTKGFMETIKETFTEREIKTLVLGAITMTLECGVRFLTDYLDGDKYFKVNYPDHNLVRCRCQLALAKDMIDKRDLMEQIVDKYKN